MKLYVLHNDDQGCPEWVSATKEGVRLYFLHLTNLRRECFQNRDLFDEPTGTDYDSLLEYWEHFYSVHECDSDFN